mmetsp:Transcript_89619/g.253876  ORF Transcript_89619/g.253876 Transcript_89619/m.253876 type:complete len:242 (-) Transcript_89619:106-831(-)
MFGTVTSGRPNCAGVGTNSKARAGSPPAVAAPRSPNRSRPSHARQSSEPPGAWAPQFRGRLASAAGALADAQVSCAHNVGPVTELLRHAGMRHRPLGFLLLPVSLHLAPQRLLLRVRRLACGRLAPALVLLLLLEVVLGLDEGDHLLLVHEACGGRQGKALAVLDPAHLLQGVNGKRHFADGRRNLGVGQLDPPELLVTRVAHHVAGELFDELQGILRFVQRQRTKGLLQRRELVCDPVAG